MTSHNGWVFAFPHDEWWHPRRRFMFWKRLPCRDCGAPWHTQEHPESCSLQQAWMKLRRDYAERQQMDRMGLS